MIFTLIRDIIVSEAIITDRSKQAKQNFYDGYSCAQAVAKAFADKVSIPEDDFVKLASSFGGGMGRLREVCGAVSAMFMVAGLLYGYSTPETGDIKTAQYARIQELARRFEAEYGTIICRELLGISKTKESPEASARTQAYYDSRPCPAIIERAAQILDDFISENERNSG